MPTGNQQQALTRTGQAGETHDPELIRDETEGRDGLQQNEHVIALWNFHAQRWALEAIVYAKFSGYIASCACWTVHDAFVQKAKNERTGRNAIEDS